MHQEDEDYDEDYNYDDSQDKYKHYFKFDPEAWDAWGKMLYDALNDIVDSSKNVWYINNFPVNSYYSNTGKTPSFQYLGGNYKNAQVWKNSAFICDQFYIMHKLHVSSNASHIINQPHYYRGMFDILN